MLTRNVFNCFTYFAVTTQDLPILRLIYKIELKSIYVYFSMRTDLFITFDWMWQVPCWRNNVKLEHIDQLMNVIWQAQKRETKNMGIYHLLMFGFGHQCCLQSSLFNMIKLIFKCDYLVRRKCEGFTHESLCSKTPFYLLLFFY